MKYLTLQVTSDIHGLIYEKDFRVQDVFEPFVRLISSELVARRILKERQRYWVSITPIFDDSPLAKETFTRGDEIPQPDQSWLSLEVSDDADLSVPMRSFTLLLQTVSSDVCTYRRGFPLAAADTLGNRVKTALTTMGLVREGEAVRVHYLVRKDDSPHFESETIHARPAVDDDLQIRIEEEEKSPPIVEKPLPAYEQSENASESVGQPAIFCQRDFLPSLHEYVSKNTTRRTEIGGVLLGGVYRQPATEHYYVEIDEFLPAHNTIASAVSLLFTPETWAKIRAEQSEHFPGKVIVGWYHTHPSLPIRNGTASSVRFFSQDDVLVHRSIFDQPWQVALVLDAESDEHGFFRWQDRTVVEAPYYLYG